jgi:hypothetical protein
MECADSTAIPPADASYGKPRAGRRTDHLGCTVAHFARLYRTRRAADQALGKAGEEGPASLLHPIHHHKLRCRTIWFEEFDFQLGSFRKESSTRTVSVCLAAEKNRSTLLGGS